MAKKIELVVDVKAGDASKQLDHIQDQTQELGTTAKGAADAYKKMGTDAEKAFGKISEKAEEANARAESLKKVTEGLVGGFQAAQGSLALFGTEAEAVQKAFEKASAAFLITDGLKKVTEGVGQLGNAFDTLKKAITSNPLFTVAVVVIGAVAAALAVLNTRQDEYIAKLEKEKESIKTRFDAVEAGYDREIALARAAGKDVTELEKKKLQATIDRVRAEIELINKRYDYEIKKNLEFLKDLGLSNKQLSDVRKAGNKERLKETEDLTKQLAQAELALEVKEIEIQTRKNENYKKSLEERNAIKKLYDDLAFRAENEGSVDEAPEVVNERAKQEKILEDFKAFSEQYRATQAYEAELLEKQRDAERIKDVQDEQTRFQEKLAIASDFNTSIANLGQVFINNQQKQEEFQKKVAAVQLAIDSAMAISKAVAASAGVPFPANLAAIATAIAAVTANMAKAKALFSKAGGSGGAPQLDIPSGGQAINVPNFANQPITNSTDVNANAVDQGQGQIGQPKPQMVYVLQGDIQNANNQYDSITNKATIQ